MVTFPRLPRQDLAIATGAVSCVLLHCVEVAVHQFSLLNVHVVQLHLMELWRDGNDNSLEVNFFKSLLILGAF